MLGAVAAQIRSVRDEAEQGPFFAPFRSFPPAIPAADANALRARGLARIRDSVVPAYQSLLAYWEVDYLPHCRHTIAASALPNGTEYYSAMVRTRSPRASPLRLRASRARPGQMRRHTTTNLAAQEVHSVGLQEVARIRGEMEREMGGLNFTAGLRPFFSWLRNDSRFFFDTEQALLAHIRCTAARTPAACAAHAPRGGRDICKRADAQLPKLFRQLPRCPYGVLPIPAGQARRALLAVPAASAECQCRRQPPAQRPITTRPPTSARARVSTTSTPTN